MKTTPAQITADGNADRLKALWGMWQEKMGMGRFEKNQLDKGIRIRRFSCIWRKSVGWNGRLQFTLYE